MNNLRAPSLQSLLESDRGSNDSILAESLQLDFDELDDNEFSIPVIDTLPTLESVLTDLDDDDSTLDLILFNGQKSDLRGIAGASSTPTPTPSIQTGSIDEASINATTVRPGTILRHVVLQGVTNQIISAADRVGAGLATSVAVNEMIAIGTSHGHILGFDCLQTLRWCCRDHVTYGAVTALSFNADNSRLLAGFAREHIIMIDTVSGDTIRTLSDVITPNSGVLNIRWTDRPAMALCSDSGGSVWALNFTRRLGIRSCTSRCLFSGARGEVCSIEPLLLNGEQHPLRNYTIAAFATLSKFFVVMIRPRLRVIKYQTMIGPAECLPLLAWQLVLIQTADSRRVIDPVLAAGRGSNLYFHQVTVQSNKIQLIFLRHIMLSYNLLAIHWLGAKTIATFDQTEMLHLTEVRTNKELECIDQASVGLVYGSSQFKGFATGGNVSEALALAGSTACYSSIVSRGTQLYVLGSRSLHVVSIRSWTDRISHLEKNHRWPEACKLALESYRSSGERTHRKQIIIDRILQLVEEYLAATVQSPEHYLRPIMDTLIEIGEHEILWQELWERLTNPEKYLLILTDHIECGNISRISPIICQILCEYWLQNSPAKLEKIILKLNWQCLDLHQVLKAAKSEKLYNAQIYLNTQALDDYSVSLYELIPLVMTPEAIARNLGNYLLVYISSCLAGRGYPAGDIPVHKITAVKHEVLRCLTSTHSQCADDTELPYPYLRTLLQFNTQETLNVLSLAFQEREFDGELGQSHRQRIVIIILEIINTDQSTWSEIGCLWNFIAQQIAQKLLPTIDDTMLTSVMEYLSKDIPSESARQHIEREESWLYLLRTDCLTHIPIKQLIRMAESSKCYRVIEHLLVLQKKYGTILYCYINDRYRNLEIWSYIDQYANDSTRNVYEQIVEHFDRLLTIDVTNLAKAIIDHWPTHLEKFIRLLDSNVENLYKFLDALIQHGIALNADDGEIYLNQLCQYNPDRVDGFLQSNKDSYRLDNALEIVKKYQLNSSIIYLYERQGDYKSAFTLSADLLKDEPESTAEACAMNVSALCLRASQHFGSNELANEEIWFPFLKLILSRPDLTQITKSILHTASSHVNLLKLVQLVLNSGTKTGNYGDIKDLLEGMLTNSKYEMTMLDITSRILGRDLNIKFGKEKKLAQKGLFCKSMKCIICRHQLAESRLTNGNVIVFADCKHSVHVKCLKPNDSEEEILLPNDCPHCGQSIGSIKPINVSTSVNSITNSSIPSTKNKLSTDNSNRSLNSESLQLNAPPRIGIGGQ